MADNYCHASFTITVAAAEAALIAQAFEAAGELWDAPDEAEAAALFARLGDAFAAAFPPGPDDPFAGFRELFDDGDYPSFDCSFEAEEPDAEGRVRMWFGGEQIAIDALPRLFHRAAPTSLPLGFEYALTCSKLRVDEFGGGFAAATAEGPVWGSSGHMLDRALARSRGEGADGYVLVIRNPEHGLSFWNVDAGFGRLADATVFSELEVANHDAVIADDQPEWLALPAPLG